MHITIISSTFFSETTWPNKTELYVEPPWEVGGGGGGGGGEGHKFKRQSWSHDKDGHHAHIMAKSVFGTRSLIILKHGMDHLGVKVFKIYINDDPE